MTIHISVELSHVCPLDDIARHAAALETGGFHRVWIPDTMVTPWEAWLAANLIVQHTTRLRIGVGVMNPYTRHPVAANTPTCQLSNLPFPPFCGRRIVMTMTHKQEGGCEITEI